MTRSSFPGRLAVLLVLLATLGWFSSGVSAAQESTDPDGAQQQSFQGDEGDGGSGGGQDPAPTTTVAPTTSTPPTSEATTTTAPSTTTSSVPETTTTTAPPATTSPPATAAPTTTGQTVPETTTTAPATTTTANALIVPGDLDAYEDTDAGAEADPVVSSSLVPVDDGEEAAASGGVDTDRVIQIVIGMLVVVALLIALLTWRYWWYTDPTRGLAPSRVVPERNGVAARIDDVPPPVAGPGSGSGEPRTEEVDAIDLGRR
ncbi:MAG: hypothetical protein S0880_13415 [Actinomycetota bacterium]|nr:hypothetical protein [Actinomycetota bacterium]